MRFLIVDPYGEALDIAIRAQQDGHKVKHFIKKDNHTENIGKGFVEIIDDFRPWLRWADLIFVADNLKYLDILDSARKEGCLIVGPSKEAAQWELDRAIGMTVFRKAGIPIPPCHTFNNYDKAISFVKRTMERYVSKPCGDADKALSYVAKSPEDLIFMLERWKKNDKLKCDFILQTFIPGVEMAVGGWFGPHGFNLGWCENFEFKKLMNGDKGVATGEQGTVVRYVKNSKLANEVLKPLSKLLEKIKYVGYIDVNCIIDEEGNPWPLEFTMRPGWPTFNIQQALHEGDSLEWMMCLAEGKDLKNFSLDTIALGVVLSIPDYPYSRITQKEVSGIPIYGIKNSIRNNIHPCQMMMSPAPVQENGKILSTMLPCTAGEYVLVMSGIGETVLQAKKKVYRHLDSLIVPNSPMWRTDIGDRLSKQLPLIQKFGYATNMKYSTTA